ANNHFSGSSPVNLGTSKCILAATTLDRRYLLVALEVAPDWPATQPLMPQTALETPRLAVAVVVPSSRFDLVVLSFIP
nr:hypothetical protein [Tanacetum cinerariifolium]